MKTREIKAIDLFAGAGGFSLAALNQNIRILSAIELDSDACDTYKKNLVTNRNNDITIYNEDIMNISPDKIMNDIGLKPKELDIIIGGPPCQGFSSHRIKNSGVDDPRNNLLIRYFDFVCKFQPKLFLVENVPGLLWERHATYLNQFKKLAENNSYKLLDPIKLNAKDFGVPQNRNRVFLLGIRNDLKGNVSWPPMPTHFRDKPPYWKTSSEVFENPPINVIEYLHKIIDKKIINTLVFNKENSTCKDDPSNIHMNHAEYMINRFAMTPINGSREDIDFSLPCHSNGYKGHKDVYGRIRLAQAGPTITTGCMNPSKGRFLHPWENHGITIRQAARFQTFPDDYIFSGGIISQAKQVGNAVPIELGEAILKMCLENLR